MKILRQIQSVSPSNKMCLQSSKNEVKLVAMILTVATIIHFICILLSNFKYYFSEDFTKTFRWYRYPSMCKMPSDMLQDMINLTSSSTKVFKELSIPSTICFGTLWGALRQESILPWEKNVDFCVMNSGIKKISHNHLRQMFLKEGVNLGDFSYQSGSYRITKGKAQGEINVFLDCTPLFYLTHSEYENKYPGDFVGQKMKLPHWACPIGWAPTVARMIHHLNEPFPAWLLQPPFPDHKLEGVNVSVPQDGIEIQKYFYPDDWWLEVTPPGCRDSVSI